MSIESKNINYVYHRCFNVSCIYIYLECVATGDAHVPTSHSASALTHTRHEEAAPLHSKYGSRFRGGKNYHANLAKIIARTYSSHLHRKGLRRPCY